MLMFNAPEPIVLRDYQEQAIEELREGIRQKMLRQVLVAPTGAGKTVMAAHLLQSAYRKESRAWFVVDRVSLVHQTSATLHRYGIPHSIIQGTRRSSDSVDDLIQVCSIQTLAKRHIPHDPDLIIYDECHVVHGSMRAFMEMLPTARKIGLTATPFTKGMGEMWDRAVNVRTTRQLIQEGHLVEPTIFVAKSPQDADLGIGSNGEFTDRSAEAAGIQIVGDVVLEWRNKTRDHFGGPVKTIVFCATVEHGRELCAAFGAAGYNFQQVSYLDRDDEERAAKIAEFRQPDSLIHGLVSCQALTRGFDVPDVMCGISCKPYRKSLSSHMQEIGRVMRPHGEGKRALWLDHSGNIERFAADMFDVWENGAGDLSSAAKHDSKPRERGEAERKAVVCPECSGALRGGTCMACGWERPARSGIHAVEGEMREFRLADAMQPRQGLRAACLSNPKAVYEAALVYALANTREEDRARKRAYAIWRGVYPDAKPGWGWYDMTPSGAAADALALVEREVNRFRKNARRAA